MPAASRRRSARENDTDQFAQAYFTQASASSKSERDAGEARRGTGGDRRHADRVCREHRDELRPSPRPETPLQREGDAVVVGHRDDETQRFDRQEHGLEEAERGDGLERVGRARGGRDASARATVGGDRKSAAARGR